MFSCTVYWSSSYVLLLRFVLFLLSFPLPFSPLIFFPPSYLLSPICFPLPFLLLFIYLIRSFTFIYFLLYFLYPFNFLSRVPSFVGFLFLNFQVLFLDSYNTSHNSTFCSQIFLSLLSILFLPFLPSSLSVILLFHLSPYSHSLYLLILRSIPKFYFLFLPSCLQYIPSFCFLLFLISYRLFLNHSAMFLISPYYFQILLYLPSSLFVIPLSRLALYFHSPLFIHILVSFTFFRHFSYFRWPSLSFTSFPPLPAFLHPAPRPSHRPLMFFPPES